jgi:quinol monooxygenase YgiN
MAVCLIMQFGGMDTRKYDAVMDKLGLRSATANWPEGILSHVAGMTSEGLCVIDVWESQQDFDAFMQSRLKPAFDAVGGLPQPRVTSFQVQNRYTSA